jgi:cellulose synthase/poly-beta-1,6-N-acetylglucosamine synthase-like glycosyltransferase
MASGVAEKAAIGRSGASYGHSTASPPTAPWPDEFQASAEADNCPEIDCLRALLPAGVLTAAAARAATIGVGADRVLIASGAITEEAYLHALGEALGVAFEPLDGIARDQCPVDDARLIESAAAGLLPLAAGDAIYLVVAPRGTAARRIMRLIDDDPARARQFRFTSAERLNRFVLRYAGKVIAAQASDELKRKWPLMSAAPPRWRGHAVPAALAGIATLACAAFAPAVTMVIVDLMLATMFLAWLSLRLTGVFLGSAGDDPPSPAAGDELPVYTVIAALYREAASVDGLLSALERLDYPPEKLDVIIAVEADDRETRAAIAARAGRMPVSVIVVPAAGPRTKPKALNVALPFARGTFTVVYDAEDRPDPDQLRRALQAFRSGGDDLACVQARLCIDNTADSWLARLFTAEYAGQFDVFLPGLAALQLPMPLGGSSNHFYTATLRAAGGWDPYNVTEDADLGMRLARFGYRCDLINSTTYEEAPAYIGPWLRQRTRWFKGWIQTWLVHMRQPRRLLADLGLPGFLALQLIVGGNALAALVHPLFLAGLIYAAVRGMPLWRGGDTAVALLAALYGTTVVIGYLSSAFLGWVGLARRGLLSSAWALALTPVHWLLLSLAAWRAVYQLAVAPYAWEKTEHGLAKTSRRADNLTRSLLRLERHLTALTESGALASLGDDESWRGATLRERAARRDKNKYPRRRA